MSTLKVNTLEEATSGGATYFTAKAWIAWNMKNTPSIHDDGNVSSITDQATGKQQINFSNNLSHANYAVGGSVAKNDNNDDFNASCHFNGYNDGNSDGNTTSKTHIRSSFNTSNSAMDTARATCMVLL